MQRHLVPQMMTHYGGTAITVVPSGRLRRQNTSLGCAITARKQGIPDDIVQSPWDLHSRRLRTVWALIAKG